MHPRFLLDEHIDRLIQRQLRRRDLRIEVLAIGDPFAPPASTPDPDILVWAEEHRYILITEDRRTIPRYLQAHHGAGRHTSGVFWLRPSTPLGRIVEELYLIWSVSTADEYVDRAIFIPL
jgi:hypothetical protein